MKPFLGALVLGLSVAGAAIAEGDVPPRFGTELEPEVNDPPGDVFYEPTYIGEQNRGHVDVLAGWVEYLPDLDAFSVNIKVASLTSIKDGVDTYAWSDCRFRVPGTVGGETSGEFTFSFLKRSDGTESSDAYFTRQTASTPVDLAHTHEIRWTEPGYISIRVNRPLMQDQAMALEGVAYVGCSEFRGYPTSETALFAAENFDNAEASANFVISESRRPGGPRDPESDVPWVTAEGGKGQSPITTRETAGLTAAGALLALGLVAAARVHGQR